MQVQDQVQDQVHAQVQWPVCSLLPVTGEDLAGQIRKVMDVQDVCQVDISGD